MSSCCAPQPERDGSPVEPTSPAPAWSGTGPGHDAMIRIEGTTFLMGSEDDRCQPADGEGPVRPVTVAPFLVDATTVTNRQFAAFVHATGWTTLAEREGWSFVFGGLLPDDFPETRGVAAAPWWRQVFGADWAHPHGPQSDVDSAGLWDHPVVHVTHADALAYCTWRGVRLPTEAEWELAARGGLEQAHYPWGHEREPGGNHRMNVWQGSFPDRNTNDDGWYGTAPADAYEPNAFGLFNTTGNVWEWSAEHFDPTGFTPQIALRGGSYLCHESYCWRYRVSARTGNTPDATLGHLGFRVAADL